LDAEEDVPDKTIYVICGPNPGDPGSGRIPLKKDSDAEAVGQTKGSMATGSTVGAFLNLLVSAKFYSVGVRATDTDFWTSITAFNQEAASVQYN
jgi:hypothetical protein